MFNMFCGLDMVGKYEILILRLVICKPIFIFPNQTHFSDSKYAFNFVLRQILPKLYFNFDYLEIADFDPLEYHSQYINKITNTCSILKFPVYKYSE